MFSGFLHKLKNKMFCMRSFTNSRYAAASFSKKEKKLYIHIYICMYELTENSLNYNILWANSLSRKRNDNYEKIFCCFINYEIFSNYPTIYTKVISCVLFHLATCLIRKKAVAQLVEALRQKTGTPCGVLGNLQET
jgi:hypothetical protein